MASFFDIGDKGSGTACLQNLTLAVNPAQSESVTVKNVSGATLSYFTNLTSSAAGTIVATGSQVFTTPTWITSAGRTSVSVTGGKYG